MIIVKELSNRQLSLIGAPSGPSEHSLWKVLRCFQQVLQRLWVVCSDTDFRDWSDYEYCDGGSDSSFERTQRYELLFRVHSSVDRRTPS